MKSKFNKVLRHVVGVFRHYRDWDHSLTGEIKLQRYTCTEGHYLFVKCRITNMSYDDLEKLHHALPRFRIDGEGLYIVLSYESILSEDGRKQFSDY